MIGADQPPGLRLSWVTDPTALAELGPDWEALAQRTEAEVYLRPAWFETWWRHFGAGRRLVCLVLHREGRLAGVLPFVLDRVRVGPLRFRIARLAGTDPHCMVFRLPVEPDLASNAMTEALARLLGSEGCDAVSFTPVSARSDLMALVREGAGWRLLEQPDGSHVVFDLPDSFEAYLSGLSRNRRSQFRRKAANLEATFSMKDGVRHPDAMEFADFVGLHNRQWQAVGRGGHFVDWPGSAAFYADLAEKDAGSVEFHDLIGQDGPLAIYFVLRAGPVAHWRLPARSLDPAAERMSIGMVGLVKMIEALIAAGATCVEAGRGEYDYKIAYGGESVAVHRLIVAPAGRRGRRRLSLLLAWADLVHLVYYRAWFLKFAPLLRQRLGLQPRPLWRYWIRTRI